MEIDGIVIPRIIKSLVCQPPAPLPLIEYFTPFKESLGTMDSRVLAQLILDTKDFDLMRQPSNIMKYENEETLEASSGQILYKLRVWYEGLQDRFLYVYVKTEDEDNGTYKLQRLDQIEFNE
jgi:hypothetical protein